MKSVLSLLSISLSLWSASLGLASAATPFSLVSQQGTADAPQAAQREAKRPAQAPTTDTDCETWKRLFKESGECFAPYRVVGGGVKKEAYKHCTVVVQPPGRCAPNL